MKFKGKTYVLIEAPVAKVWSALTTKAGLEGWLVESASGDLRAGADVKLVSEIALITGTHTVESLDLHQRIAFAWRVRDEETRVVWRVEDFNGLTRLTVSHEMSDELAAHPDMLNSFGEAGGILEYVWYYGFVLLKDFLENGRAQCRLIPGDDPGKIDWSVEVAATPREAFRALVEPERIAQWNPFRPAGAKPAVDPRVGGRYSFGWGSEARGTDGPDEIVTYQDDHKIEYTWHGETGKTLVGWTVEPLPDAPGPRTRIRLMHSGFHVDPKVVREFKLGWTGFLFAVAVNLRPARQGMNDWIGRAE